MTDCEEDQRDLWEELKVNKKRLQLDPKDLIIKKS